MKLTRDQIDQLKKLISYKGYPEIDVQYEILDHVACKVEALLEENPKLGLDDAFRKVHSSFGIFGFSTLEESYKKAIEKRIRKSYWQELTLLLTSFRILYPILLGLLIYQATLFLNDPQAWVLFLAGFLILGTSIFVIRYWKSHQAYKSYASYIGSTHIFQIINLGTLCAVYSYQFVYKNSGDTSLLFTYLFKGAIILVLIWYSLSLFILPRLLEKSIAETQKLKTLYET